MDLLKEILTEALKRSELQVSVTNMDESLEQVAEKECYKALKRIKSVLEDETLDDRECFMKIEQIVRIFEEMGGGVSGRHDFG